jgi:hypothetical protein
VVNSSFPTFFTSQVGAHVESLKNYNLPDFILRLVAKDCDSDLPERGRLDKKLQSMNKKAIDLLYQIFVNCDKSESGKYDLYRFYTYVSSMYYKCDILINEKISGHSGKNYLIPVAVKSNGMYIAVAFNKFSENTISKQEIKKFYNIVDDLKRGDFGTQLDDAIYCSSAGFSGNALVELENLNGTRSKDPEAKINFKVANFENRIYSLMKC